MTEKEAKSKLIDYLYNEMPEHERIEFEKFLSNSTELQRELRELQSTKKLLREEPGEIPPKNLLVLPPDSESHERSSSRKTNGIVFYMKTAIAIAAAVLLTILAFTFVNLQIHQDEQGLIISFGNQSSSTFQQQSDSQISEEELYVLISELQEENTRVFANVLEQTRQEHQQQMADVIQNLTAYYDQRRQQDLILISEGLAQLEEETYYRFLQTEEALEDLIFALSYQQPEE